MIHGSHSPKPPESRPQPITRHQARLNLFKKAFTEWDRRYREEPEKFMSEVHRLLKETPYSYGNACAVYFDELLSDVKSGEIS